MCLDGGITKCFRAGGRGRAHEVMLGRVHVGDGREGERCGKAAPLGAAAAAGAAVQAPVAVGGQGRTDAAAAESATAHRGEGGSEVLAHVDAPAFERGGPGGGGRRQQQWVSDGGRARERSLRARGAGPMGGGRVRDGPQTRQMRRRRSTSVSRSSCSSASGATRGGSAMSGRGRALQVHACQGARRAARGALLCRHGHNRQPRSLLLAGGRARAAGA